MKNRNVVRLSFFLIVAIFAVVLFKWLAPSDKAKITKLLKDLSTNASFEGQVHPFVQLEWASSMMKSCREPCTVLLHLTDELKEYKLSHQEGIQHLLAIRKMLAQVAVAVLSPKIELDGERATVHATARVMGKTPGRDDYYLESHPVEIKLIKEDRLWLISSIENLDTIETGSE